MMHASPLAMHQYSETPARPGFLFSGQATTQ
jgi:hypothetical protein